MKRVLIFIWLKFYEVVICGILKWASIIAGGIIGLAGALFVLGLPLYPLCKRLGLLNHSDNFIIARIESTAILFALLMLLGIVAIVVFGICDDWWKIKRWWSENWIRAERLANKNKKGKRND